MNFAAFISLTCSVCLAVCFSSNSVNAATFGKFTYRDTGTSITITSYSRDATGAVDIPSTIVGKPVTIIQYSAFANCAGLTSVTIPFGVTRLGNGAFYRCSGLTSVTIPSSVHNIGDFVFFRCSGLTGINIPSRVNNIGLQAFGECHGLTNVTIPASVNSIGVGAFLKCSALNSIDVDAANPTYASENGLLFNKGKTTLLQCPAGRKGALTIPASVTNIEYLAFGYCIGLTSVTIPSSVTSIGAAAFGYCSGLTNLAIPSSVNSIGGQAFDSCTGLNSVTIPSSVNSIGNAAFLRCAGLTSVVISEGVTSIGDRAFKDCSGLPSVTIPSSVTSMGDNVFQACSALTSATFLGNAPATGTSVFYQHALGFTVYYQEGSQGFTSPKWRNYQAVALSSAPEMNVQQPAGSSLVDGTAKKSFGTVAVGVTSSAKTFTVTNTGLSDLKGLAITLDGSNGTDFNLTPFSKSTLTPGGKASFKVSFTPTATGTRRAAVHITSNDADEAPFDIQLGGMGVAP